MELVNTAQHFKDLFELPKEMQRYKFYAGRIVKQGKIVVYKDEEDLFYYAESLAKLYFNQSLYVKHGDRRGFTYDKKKKKVTLWFKKSINHLTDLHVLLKHLRMEWVVNEGLIAFGITKTELEKILSGKITNPEEFFKSFIKSNRLKNITAKKLYKYFKEQSLSKREILYLGKVSKNLDHALDSKKDRDNRIMHDLCRQALVLDRQIDFKWSTRRMNEVHTEWTRDIMAMEIDSVDDIVYYNSKPPKLPKNYSLITTRRDLFVEGTEMDHCVYSNYENRVRNGEYFVLKFDDGIVRATIGLKLTRANDQLVIDQAYKKRNEYVNSQYYSKFKKDIGDNKALEKWIIEQKEEIQTSRNKRGTPQELEFGDYFLAL